jgi:molybdate transport system ATP-binding protein
VTLSVDVRCRAGDFLLEAALDVADGETVALLGPNGAGKTTLLRAVAGLHPLVSGRVELDGAALHGLAPERRPIGVVFQDGLLFPHLGALDNVAFGLRCRGVRRREARTRARAGLASVGLSGRDDARPHELSGGQAQLVALARALAAEPRVLLLDEPLSSLDTRMRAETRRHLRRGLGAFGGPRLIVTHDPLEAVALADRMVILEEGRVVQEGTAADVRARPRSTYAADLAGLNLYRGRASAGTVVTASGHELAAPGAPAGDVFAVVHPRAVALYRERPEGTPRNVWPGTVDDIDPEGDRARLRIGGPLPIVAEVTRAAAAEFVVGTSVWVAVKATEVTTYPA